LRDEQSISEKISSFGFADFWGKFLGAKRKKEKEQKVS
jgi:hypothetical protein